MHQGTWDDWKLICEPVWLCGLPFDAIQVAEKLDIAFEKHLEQGLGRVLYAIVIFKGKTLLLKSCLDGPLEAQLVSVMVLGQETEWELIISNLCHVFGIARDAIPMEQEELQSGKWALLRLDDNNNFIEMFRFPNEWRASQAKKVYEKRGHKQAYFIREINH